IKRTTSLQLHTLSLHDALPIFFTKELEESFAELGFKEVTIKAREAENHDRDPLIIEIYYNKLTEKDAYLKPGVLVEVGSRSLKRSEEHTSELQSRENLVCSLLL